MLRAACPPQVAFLETAPAANQEEEEKRKKLAGLQRTRSKKALAKQRASYSHSNSNDHADDLALLRRKFVTMSFSNGKRDFARLFKHYDRNNSGKLDFEEFRHAVRADGKLTKEALADKDLKRLFNAMDDGNGDGEIDLDEFVRWIHADTVLDTTSSPRAVEQSHRRATSDAIAADDE